MSRRPGPIFLEGLGRRPAPRRPRPSPWLFALRWGLPAALVVAGIVVALVQPAFTGLEGAALFIGAAFALVVLSLLVRIGNQGEREREHEEAARAYFDRHGRWPDE